MNDWKARIGSWASNAAFTGNADPLRPALVREAASELEFVHFQAA
jgi:hypothetical protein